MSTDMNKPIVSNNHQPQVAMNVNTFGAVISKAVGGFIETITREAKSEEKTMSVMEIQESKEKTLMQSAITQRILNDADPKSRSKFNIVI